MTESLRALRRITQLYRKHTINREKTRVVNLKEEGASLDFLGFTFRYYDDLQGRGWRYLNVS
ncbi:MAG TPA: hypothetical protein VHY84_12315, partial [Bryobacteraceae bacterium]|nr:hypothetical protein [Bryobacteraceae bacterium]